MNIVRTLLHGIGVSISSHPCSILLITFILQCFNLVVGCQCQKVVLVVKFGNGCNRVSSNVVEITNQLIGSNARRLASLNNGGCHALQ
ncbi:Uncharacterised protein [Klebsiella pneumoniae]|nr:Uncharacterised protein [Klebsiella pneumoniae]SXL38348.1 Uncharacterised protein [Klebsiella pneumoniae]